MIQPPKEDEGRQHWGFGQRAVAAVAVVMVARRGGARTPTLWQSLGLHGRAGKGRGSMTASTRTTTRTTTQTTTQMMPNQTMTTTMTMKRKKDGAVGDWLSPAPAPTLPTRPPAGKRTGENDRIVGGRGECNDVNCDVGRRRASTMPVALAIVTQR
jgi:hypothetical protein